MEVGPLMNCYTPTLLAFFLTFLLVYLIAYFILFRHWGPRARPFATSCFTSLAHGTPAAFLAARAIYREPPGRFASPNSAAQSTALEFSMAYFLTDLLHYLVFFPHDTLFIIHHVATLFVLLTCRYVVSSGAYGILVLLILAEITSPCQNTWSIAKVRRDVSTAADKYYRFLSPYFYALYSMVRGIIGPTFVYELVTFYAGELAEDSIPRWAWISWIVVIVCGILVSIIWVLNNWKLWYSERSSEVEKKFS
ncbi:hypothetical protein SAY87_013830 [Trapa incisa]|uniref:TLC domain-containing protein n=1 Tax=Trapa incisa TaxID=236973 RepID=A0AAN7KJC5_9MYRT|nr:hypothetical protein SAY87_013830 [Trapa incisa]